MKEQVCQKFMMCGSGVMVKHQFVNGGQSRGISGTDLCAVVGNKCSMLQELIWVELCVCVCVPLCLILYV